MPISTTLEAREEQPEALQIASTLANAIAGALAPCKVGDAWLVNIPAGYQQKDITELVEKASAAPFRKRGRVALSDVPSLLAYCADQAKQADGYIYANPDLHSITAVFNDHRSDRPGWRDHSATFEAEFTPEFKLWLSQNKQQKSQSDFAEFIEDNLPDLQGDDAKLLLNVATTIQASTGINFASAKRLQDGQTQLTYNEVIDAKAGADGSLKIPQTFTLGMRIFKNGGGYKLTARLKFRLAGGNVRFWYELERPERAVEDAFAGYVTEVREKSGYTVLVGKA